MRKNEADQFARLLASQQKWQMAAFLLVDELREHGIDMHWVIDADKQAIVECMLLRMKTRKLGESRETWEGGDGI